MEAGSVRVVRTTTFKEERNAIDAISLKLEMTSMESQSICINKSLESLTIHHQVIILSQVKVKDQLKMNNEKETGRVRFATILTIRFESRVTDVSETEIVFREKNRYDAILNFNK